MEHKKIYVKENIGNGKVQVQISSREIISDADLKYVSSLTYNELKNYGKVKHWTVLAINK